jgi:hypothetical protein
MNKLKSNIRNEVSLRKTFCKKMLVMTLIMAMVLNNPWFGNTVAVQAASLTYTIDYTTETLIVTPSVGGQNSKIYMSSDNMKTWDIIDLNTSTNTYKIDISTLLSTKAVTIYFKGNKDTDIVQITIPVQNISFKPVYTIVAGVGSIVFTSATSVQYRNGANGTWTTVTSPMNTQMYEIKGASLYFRIAPTTGTRAGKVVTVKVPKKPTAPAVKLDASKLIFTGIKTGETLYRTGDDTIWTKVTSATGAAISVTSLLTHTDISNTTAISAGTIEFMTPGTDKKLGSAVKVIQIPQQLKLAEEVVSITGSSISIVDTDTKKAYEYTVVTQGKNLDYTKAKWTQITSKNSVKVPKVSIGDKILVRLKSTIVKDTGLVNLPSTFVERTVNTLSH